MSVVPPRSGTQMQIKRALDNIIDAAQRSNAMASR